MITKHKLRQMWAVSRLAVVGSLLIVVSGIFIVIALFANDPDLKATMNTIASGALGGGVFAWLTKLAQFGGVFKEELESIIYGERHLASRKDKEELWMNATRSLYGDRFPELRDRLSSDTLKSVWPSEHRFYLSDVRRRVDISLVDSRKNWVQIDHKLVCDLITDTSESTSRLSIERPSTLTFHHESLSDSEAEALINSGKATYQLPDDPDNIIEDRIVEVKELGDGWSIIQYSATLEPSRIYIMKEESSQVQNLETDNVTSFVAMSYVDGLNVAVNYDDRQLNVLFMEVGSVEFTDCEPNLSNIHKETNDLLFSDVGFLVSIQLRADRQ